jgi:hypothetical protein
VCLLFFGAFAWGVTMEAYGPTIVSTCSQGYASAKVMQGPVMRCVQHQAVDMHCLPFAHLHVISQL